MCHTPAPAKYTRRWNMSERFIRESTKQLRRCFSTPRRTKPRARAETNAKQDEEHQENMDAGQNEQRQEPGANDAPAGGQQQDDTEAPRDPPASPARSTDSARKRSSRSATPGGDYDKRLQNIEEMLLEMRQEKKARKRSRSQSRSTMSRPSTPKDTRRTKSPEKATNRSYHRSPSYHRRRRSSSRTSGGSSRSSRRRSSSRHRHRSGGSRSSRRSRSRSRSARPRSKRRRTRSSSRRRDQRSKARTSSITPADELKEALEAQYPSMGSHKGKRLHKSKATLEPYRNLPPDIRENARARRSRRDLTFAEHMCGMLYMVLGILDPSSELYGVIRHMAHVAEDATAMVWKGVRDWSQACLTTIQDGDADWTSNLTGLVPGYRGSEGNPKKRGKSPVTHTTPLCVVRRTTTRQEGLHTCTAAWYASTDWERKSAIIQQKIAGANQGSR